MLILNPRSTTRSRGKKRPNLTVRQKKEDKGRRQERDLLRHTSGNAKLKILTSGILTAMTPKQRNVCCDVRSGLLYSCCDIAWKYTKGGICPTVYIASFCPTVGAMTWDLDPSSTSNVQYRELF